MAEDNEWSIERTKLEEIDAEEILAADNERTLRAKNRYKHVTSSRYGIVPCEQGEKPLRDAVTQPAWTWSAR